MGTMPNRSAKTLRSESREQKTGGEGMDTFEVWNELKVKMEDYWDPSARG